MINSNYNSNVNFGMKNNAKAAKRALKHIEPDKREAVYRGVNQFCDQTQRMGIKGELKLNGVKTKTGGSFCHPVEYPVLSLSMRFPKNNKWHNGEVYLTESRNCPLNESVRIGLFDELDLNKSVKSAIQ